MKYITTITDEDVKEIFIFPESINHDAMMEALERIRNKTHGDWKRVFREPVSAGFIHVEGNCHGESISLGLKSSPDDTLLLNT